MAFKIIDAHMHLGPNPGRMVPDQAVESLIAQMDRLGIERCISANRYGLRCMYEKSLANDLAASQKCDGRIYSFMLYHTKYADQALNCIHAHKDDPRCVGLKVLPITDGVDADSEAYRPLWEAARATGRAIMAHTWDVSTYNLGQKHAFPGKFEKWLAEYPDVTFVFGHSGGRYNGIKKAIELGKKYPNAYYDIAGDIWQHGFLEELVEGIGDDRIIYGSDYTMIEHRPVLGIVYGANISNCSKEKILYYNAAKVYFKEE